MGYVYSTYKRGFRSLVTVHIAVIDFCLTSLFLASSLFLIALLVMTEEQGIVVILLVIVVNQVETTTLDCHFGLNFSGAYLHQVFRLTC